jgi:hypothetical protein
VLDAHELGAFVDCEEHAVDVTAAAAIHNANRLVLIEAFRRDSKSAQELLERKNRALETVEPGRPWLDARSMTQRYSRKAPPTALNAAE